MSEMDLQKRINELEKQIEEYKRVIETISMMEKSERISKYLNNWKTNSKLLSLINSVNDEPIDFLSVQEENAIRFEQERIKLEEQISWALKQTLHTDNTETIDAEVFLTKEHESYVEIIGFAGFDSDLIVTPSTINKKPVKVIGNNAFQKTKSQRIVISEPVTTIGKNAFQKAECESIILPNSLKRIEDEAFWGCDRLVNVVMSSNIVSIGKRAFEQCINLKTINLPETLTELGEECFYDSGLERIVLPGSINQIPPSCFFKCRKLKDVILKDGILEIEYDAFTKTDISEIVIPKSVKQVNNKLLDCSFVANGKTIKLVFLGRETTLIKSTLRTSHIAIYCDVGSEILSEARRMGYEVHPLSEYISS